MGSKTNGRVKLLDVSLYPNLTLAEGQEVSCVIEDVGEGDKLYHVQPATLKALGCDVGTCRYAYPFYDSEVTVVNKQE